MELLSSVKKGVGNAVTKVKNILYKPFEQFIQPKVGSSVKKSPIESFLLLQLLSLAVALAQALGAPVSAKLQYTMIILNTVMMLGQIEDFKDMALSPKL